MHGYSCCSLEFDRLITHACLGVYMFRCGHEKRGARSKTETVVGPRLFQIGWCGSLSLTRMQEPSLLLVYTIARQTLRRRNVYYLFYSFYSSFMRFGRCYIVPRVTRLEEPSLSSSFLLTKWSFFFLSFLFSPVAQC